MLSLCDESLHSVGTAGPVVGFPLSEEKLRRIRLPVIEDIGERKFFLNPWSIPETVYIFGAGHVGQETAELAGKSGFRTIVLDDREKYANRDRFPTADDVVVLDSFDDCFRGLAVTDDSYVIIATRGHRYEKALVKQALRTRAGYIGLIGSVRKRDALFAELSGEGFSIDDLLRVYCPTGVNILAETSVEIAVSIVAQLVLLRARKAAANRREILESPVSVYFTSARNQDESGMKAVS
jgi:xanthine dehydrogenase accessory factor